MQPFRCRAGMAWVRRNYMHLGRQRTGRLAATRLPKHLYAFLLPTGCLCSGMLLHWRGPAAHG